MQQTCIRNDEKFGSDHVTVPERSHGSTELSSSERKDLQRFGCQETLKQLYKKNLRVGMTYV